MSCRRCEGLYLVYTPERVWATCFDGMIVEAQSLIDLEPCTCSCHGKESA